MPLKQFLQSIGAVEEDGRYDAEGFLVPKQFGNGVWFFDAAASFPDQLSHFIGNHPGLRVVAIGALDNIGYGSTAGYTVVTEKK